MRVSDYILEALLCSGVRVTYGIGGGSVEAIQDAMYGVRDRMRFVLARHETGACFMAHNHWCFSGEVAAVLATSGAGIFNAYNGVAEAFVSRVPMIVIAGAIATSVESRALFQNTSGQAGSPDLLQAFAPVTVYRAKVDSVEDVPRALHDAIQAATGPRRGPVLLIVPRDVQSATIDRSPAPAPRLAIPESGDLDAVIAALRGAKRPLLVVGEGVKRHRAEAALRELAEKTGLPVATTPQGKDCFPNAHPQHLGTIGMFGVPRANACAQASDLLVFVGATEDPLNWYPAILKPGPRAAILEGDGGYEASPTTYAGDIAAALRRVTAALDGPARPALALATTAAEDNTPLLGLESGALNTNAAIKRICARIPAGASVLFECGLVAAAAIHFARLADGVRQELTIAGASMGFAVAGAVGAAVACPGRPTIVCTGDGSLLMNGMEIHAAVSEGLDVLFVVFNNSGHGIGVKAQSIFYDGRTQGTSFRSVDFLALARSLGVETVARVSDLSDLDAAFARALAAPGVRVLELEIAEEGCPPMLSFLQRAAGAGPHEIFA